MNGMMRTLVIASSVALTACIPTLPDLANVMAGRSSLASPSPSAGTATPTASPTASPVASASPVGALPASGSAITVTGMKTSTCAEEGTIRSGTGASTYVRFTNNSAGRITVYWLNTLGRRVEYRKLAKGESYEQQTFVTHPWLITGEQGQCLGIYTPESTVKATLVVAESGTSVGSTAPGPLNPVTEETITEARARDGAACLRAKGDTASAAAVEGLINVYVRSRAILGEEFAKKGYLAPVAKVLNDKGC